MSEQFVDQAETVVDNDTGALDAEPSEILDEDRMDADPLEDGMDGSDGYSRDVRFGGTQEWETEPATIDRRLPQEQPEAGADEEVPDRPLTARPIEELDESIDDPQNAVDGVGGAAVLDPTGADGTLEDGTLADELPSDDGRAVELGVSSADGSVEETGLPSDDAIGEIARLDNEIGSAEEQALRVEQES